MIAYLAHFFNIRMFRCDDPHQICASIYQNLHAVIHGYMQVCCLFRFNTPWKVKYAENICVCSNEDVYAPGQS